MTNGDDTGQSSNTNPTRPNPERITVNRGQNAPPPPPPPLPPPRPRTLPRQWPPPIMGIPGVSAFTRYRRSRRTTPPPLPSTQSLPRPHGGYSTHLPHGSSGGQTGPKTGNSEFGGSQEVQTVLVGGSGGGASSHCVRIGGNPGSRKRGRDGGIVVRRDQAEGLREGGVDPVQCTICGKTFMSVKALFGHMRSHPGRGWKGAHPPPAFKADEEFADLRPLYQSGASGDAEASQREDREAPERDGGVAGEKESMEAVEGEEEGGGRRNIPDLNA